ncbi:MAG TPA: helix-turn-helix transcriptional regulator [Firmicutes bacterium]|nr:helix-turn-helix transcriptional regulator [Bacillota bacterium]
MRVALRKARLKAGLSQAELAREVGLTRASYTNIEKGYRHPSLVTALQIARVLRTPVEELFSDEFPGDRVAKAHGAPGAL